MEKLLSFLFPENLLLTIKGIKNRNFKNWTVRRWQKAGCPLPPPHQVKLATIEEYQKLSGYEILVETGTFKGDTIEAERKIFKQIFSVELGRKLYEKAKYRFRKYKHIRLYHGDSGKVLPDIVSCLSGPAIFWLDGHYSGGITAKGDTNCPLFRELDAIFQDRRFKHILIIDDADCFNGTDDYPSIKELAAYISDKNSGYNIEVKHGLILVTTFKL